MKNVWGRTQNPEATQLPTKTGEGDVVSWHFNRDDCGRAFFHPVPAGVAEYRRYLGRPDEF